ncbi:HTH domain-containing protein [Treponema berlinense]|uniref:HTH domain-containing protein n=1 Tax=Treponema berlinense TaxID=225004 RepID=UPI0026EA01B5|nr:HTH domain-containing protein [Treponema berlinense]
MIEKICRLCKEYGIEEPEYTVHPNDIMMLFKASEPVNSDLLGKLPSKLPSNLEITYKAICEDNHDSNKELADKTNQSERTIRNHTAKLKELNCIKRVGSDKTGYWEILK